ncbi:MAG: hypothetical protein AAGN35_24355 [Bacteroidota bacterium]
MKPFTRIRRHLAPPTKGNSYPNKSDHEPNHSPPAQSPHQEGANPGASDDHRLGFPADRGQTNPATAPNYPTPETEPESHHQTGKKLACG